MERPCVICGEVFRSRGQRRQRYCSLACRQVAEKYYALPTRTAADLRIARKLEARLAWEICGDQVRRYTPEERRALEASGRYDDPALWKRAHDSAHPKVWLI